MRILGFSILLSCATMLASVHGSAQISEPSGGLQPPSTFDAISDPVLRSRALFTEATKVIMNPRCMNCHPSGDRPTQGNDKHVHLPPVIRGDGGGGVPGNTCAACHTDANYTLHERASYRSIPGNARWALAPIEMAWEGKSIGEICLQLKDPKRNGGRTLALLHRHAASDDLIAWGWDPGAGRDPAPGTQELFGQLIKAWIDSGAQCP
jgi:hypothetical protein